MKCKCGRRMSKYASTCRKCHRAETAKLRAEYLLIAKAGVCPECGGKLQRNSALSGWYQCEQLGAEQFRANPSQPSCPYQFIIPEED